MGRSHRSVPPFDDMPRVAADEARDLARAFLRKKSWAGQYLYAAKDVIEVLDRQSHWHVVFRHTRWRSEKPGKGIVVINKRTGTSVWRTPNDATR
jgi:hypothetical protein